MTKRRRFWPEDEKRSICRQARAPGVSVACVARRYSLNANLVFKWLRDPRFAPSVSEEAVFLPVEVSSGAGVDPAPVPDGRLVIELSAGERIVIEGSFDPEALGRFLKVWRP